MYEGDKTIVVGAKWHFSCLLSLPKSAAVVAASREHLAQGIPFAGAWRKFRQHGLLSGVAQHFFVGIVDGNSRLQTGKLCLTGLVKVVRQDPGFAQRFAKSAKAMILHQQGVDLAIFDGVANDRLFIPVVAHAVPGVAGYSTNERSRLLRQRDKAHVQT